MHEGLTKTHTDKIIYIILITTKCHQTRCRLPKYPKIIMSGQSLNLSYPNLIIAYISQASTIDRIVLQYVGSFKLQAYVTNIYIYGNIIYMIQYTRSLICKVQPKRLHSYTLTFIDIRHKKLHTIVKEVGVTKYAGQLDNLHPS